MPLAFLAVRALRRPHVDRLNVLAAVRWSPGDVREGAFLLVKVLVAVFVGARSHKLMQEAVSSGRTWPGSLDGQGGVEEIA